MRRSAAREQRQVPAFPTSHYCQLGCPACRPRRPARHASGPHVSTSCAVCASDEARTSTVARKVAPDSSGKMYVGSATARLVNHAAPPVSKEGSSAMRWMPRKKQMNRGACASIGTNALKGLQSYLHGGAGVSTAVVTQLAGARTSATQQRLHAGTSPQHLGRPSGGGHGSRQPNWQETEQHIRTCVFMRA